VSLLASNCLQITTKQSLYITMASSSPSCSRNEQQSTSSCSSESSQGRSLLSQFKLSDEQLQNIRDRFLRDIVAGLKLNTSKQGIDMLPTFVCNTPDGTENGNVLALDLGGTNFRVLLVHIPDTPNQRVDVDSQLFMIPDHLRCGTGVQLFDHIVECIQDFLKRRTIPQHRLPLGFTFSFPCHQKGLNKSVLLRWTKGYKIPDVVGQDVVQLLTDALNRRTDMTHEVVVEAVVNDSVGTMMTCAYNNQDCSIGIIIGTGTNACYMEDIDAIEKLEQDGSTTVPQLNGHTKMCINTEWGGFGENGSLDDIRTDCDNMVDVNSINPGQMLYEKMIGGMYMGEVCRYLVLGLVRSGALLSGNVTEELERQGSFPSAFITQIEQDDTEDLEVALQCLENLGYDEPSLQDCVLLREACQTVSRRSAYLCATGVAALVKRTMETNTKRHEDGLFHVTVGVDGTMYKKHPTFRHHLSEKTAELVDGCRVKFVLSVDGSGKGVALVTAVACRKKQQQQQHLQQG